MPNVLVVDDESAIRESLQGVLEDEGYKVAAAATGEAAIESVQNQSFDLVLLDIWLPGIDGLETLERIRELDNSPEVIIISGSDYTPSMAPDLGTKPPLALPCSPPQHPNQFNH